MSNEHKGEGGDEKEKDTSESTKILAPLVLGLLKPTADHLGKELKEGIKSKLDAWKKDRRQKNVEGHFNQVRQKLTDRHAIGSFDTVQKANLLMDWIEGAQDVEPDHSPLSDLWQELLIKIALGIGDRFLIDKLKQVTPDQAQLLLKCVKPYQTSDMRNLYNLHELKRIGLVAPAYLSVIMIPIVMIIGLTSFLLTPRNSQMNTAFILIISIAFLGFALCGILFAGLAAYGWIRGNGNNMTIFSFVRWNATWIGHELVKHAPVSANDSGQEGAAQGT